MSTHPLSSRIARPTAAVLPQISATIAQRTAQTPKTSNKIDLATAENWVVRPELVTLCKEAMARDLDAEVGRRVCLGVVFV